MHTVLLSQRAERAVDGPDRPDWISGQVVSGGKSRDRVERCRTFARRRHLDV